MITKNMMSLSENNYMGAQTRWTLPGPLVQLMGGASYLYGNRGDDPRKNLRHHPAKFVA